MSKIPQDDEETTHPSTSACLNFPLELLIFLRSIVV